MMCYKKIDETRNAKLFENKYLSTASQIMSSCLRVFFSSKTIEIENALYQSKDY